MELKIYLKKYWKKKLKTPLSRPLEWVGYVCGNDKNELMELFLLEQDGAENLRALLFDCFECSSSATV